MNIFYPLLCYYPSEAGGPANTIYWLNKTLGKYNFHSIVLSTKYGLPKIIVNGTQLYKNHNIDAEFISGTIFSFFKKRQIDKIKKSDVIHFSSLFFKPTIFYLILGLLWSKKVIISPRGELYEAAISHKPLKKKIYLKLVKLFQREIEFQSTNPVETELIKNHFPNARNVVEIPNFIVFPERIEMKTKKQILYLGRINPIKNIHLLIEAYYQLSENVKSSYILLIAGEAILDYEKTYLNELKELINKLYLIDNVKLIGGIYGKQKEQILAESFCTVLPSKSENFGVVVLESLCQRTPVIVTKNAPWEIIEEYNAGYWIDPTVSNLKNSLDSIISLDTKEYRLKRESAFNLAFSKFDISKNIDLWINFYNKSL